MSHFARAFAVAAILLAALALASRADAAIVGAVHHGTATSTAIRWESRLVLDATPTTDAAPIALVSVTDPTAISNLRGPFRLEQRQDGLVLIADPDRAPYSMEATWTTTQDFDPTAAVRLRPPLLSQSPAQIVEVSPLEGRAFRPKLGTSLDMRLGYFADPSLRHGEPERWNHVLGFEPASSRSTTLYLREAADFEDGIPGELGPISNIPRVGWGWAGLVLGLTLGLSWITYRRLARTANVERAEADLEAEFRNLDSRHAPRRET